MIVWILILATILRLITLNQSLWFDEANNVLSAKNLSFWHFVTGYPLGDFHPPGYFALLWVWSHLFGFSEIAVRLPSVLLGLGTIYLTYLLGRELFSRRVGVLAAFFIAIGPLDVYYSQEARMYSLAAFAVTLSFYFLHKLLSGQKRWLPVYIFSIGLVLYSDYVAYFALVSQAAFILILARERWKRVIIGWLGGFLLLFPWLLVFPAQLRDGQVTAQVVSGWASVVGGASLKNLGLLYAKTLIGRVSFVNKWLYAAVIVPLAAFYTWIIWRPIRQADQAVKLLVFWLGLPVLCALMCSLVIPVFAYFRMIFILPAFYLLMAKGVDSLPRKWFEAVVSFIAASAIIFLSAYYTNPTFQRENWRGLAKFLSGPEAAGAVVLFENSNLPAPYIYYDQKKTPSYGALSHFPAQSEADIAGVNKVVSGKERVYLVNYLVDISDPKRLVEEKLIALGYRKTKTYDFPSLGFVYLYAK